VWTDFPKLVGDEVAVVTYDRFNGKAVWVDGEAGPSTKWRVFPSVEAAHVALHQELLTRTDVAYSLYDRTERVFGSVLPGPRETMRYAVFARAHERWRRISSTLGWLRRAWEGIFGKVSAEGFYLVEHDAVDRTCGRCEGNVVRAWLMDEAGLRLVEAEAVATGAVSDAGLWAFWMVRFCIDDGDLRAFVDESEGPEKNVRCVLERPDVESLHFEVKRLETGR
jgi:hypothetical protein